MSQQLSLATGQDTARILIGGFVATLVITLLMYFGAPMMTGAPMDIAGELSRMVGTPWVVGMMAHFILGTVVFPFTYAYVAHSLLPGNDVVRGLLWGATLWFIAMLVMAPMMGKGVFMGAAPAAMSSLIGHLAYGLVLGLIVPPAWSHP